METMIGDLRRWEIDSLKSWFVPGMRVLELGGANGQQASIIASWGCQVRSLDIAGRATIGPQLYPVQDYDGRHIPFADASFDMVFSSNVLEHVTDLPGLLGEMRRVAAPGATLLHVMPSAVWRFWTSLTHYVYVLNFVFRRQNRIPGTSETLSLQAEAGKHGWGWVVRRGILAGPHGEYANALAELYCFSRARWLGVFDRAGYDVVYAAGNGVFYTGFGTLSGFSLAARRKASRWLGSSCNVFVMRSREKARPAWARKEELASTG